MARIHHVKAAQQRYATVPVLDDDGTQRATAVTRKDGTPKVTKRGKPIVRRVTTEDRTQPLPPYVCGSCHQPIEIGTPYKWVATKSGPYGGTTLRRHETCPTWRPSELTSSKMAGVYAAQEQCDDQVSDCEDIADLEVLRDDLAQQVRDVAEEYRESGSNIEDGFGHATVQSDELNEKAELLDGWAEDIDAVQFDEFEEPDEEEGDDDHEGTVDAAREEWLDEQRDRLTEAMGECPL